jgi:hypothetical protein
VRIPSFVSFAGMSRTVIVRPIAKKCDAFGGGDDSE